MANELQIKVRFDQDASPYDFWCKKEDKLKTLIDKIMDKHEIYDIRCVSLALESGQHIFSKDFQDLKYCSLEEIIEQFRIPLDGDKIELVLIDKYAGPGFTTKCKIFSEEGKIEIIAYVDGRPVKLSVNEKLSTYTVDRKYFEDKVALLLVDPDRVDDDVYHVNKRIEVRRKWFNDPAHLLRDIKIDKTVTGSLKAYATYQKDDFHLSPKTENCQITDINEQILKSSLAGVPKPWVNWLQIIAAIVTIIGLPLMIYQLVKPDESNEKE